MIEFEYYPDLIFLLFFPIVTIQPAEDLIGKRNNLTSVTQPLPLIDKVKTEKEDQEDDKIGKNNAQKL